MKGLESIRSAYGKALVEAGKKNERLIVLDADVSNSTRTVEFAHKYPERFFNMGIAEANMVCMAAGLATMGLIPVVNTFSFLLCERALDQIRSSVAYNNLNVKLAANYGGLSDSFDGASHHSITDLAIINSIPGMTLVVLSDAAQTRSALEAILNHQGPVYFRLCRAETPVVHPEGEKFEIGKGIVLAEGTDLTIVSTGILVSKALKLRERLLKDNIVARVVEIHTIKPLDEALIEKCAEETGAILTCEEANIMGGLGAAVAQLVCRKKPVPVDCVGINDCYAESGAYEELLERYVLPFDTTIKKAKALVEKKAVKNQ